MRITAQKRWIRPASSTPPIRSVRSLAQGIPANFNTIPVRANPIKLRITIK